MATAPDTEPNDTIDTRSKPPFLRRVRIRGYKSIAFCDVTLEPFTILVGRNASGKSNFLDALAFLRDVVNHGLHEAVRSHGGHDAILCRFSSATTVTIDIEGQIYASSRIPGTWILRSDDLWSVSYGLEIDFSPDRYPRIVGEQVQLLRADGEQTTSYTSKAGKVTWSGDTLTHPISNWANSEKTILGMCFGNGPFTELSSYITSIATYNFNPEAMRRPQKPNPGSFLERDGSNLASVINTSGGVNETPIDRVSRYLNVVTNSAEFTGTSAVGGYETLRFQTRRGDGTVLEFDAASMSDGTLRVLAALVAAFQNIPPYGAPTIVAIEEPETSLHPAAMRALVDALDEATLRTQVLLTTHSAEMLENPTIKPENIRVVQMIDGQTVIAPVDEASIEIVRRNLDTLGGLERQNQLEPDLDDLDRQRHLSQNGQVPKA
ncbi:aaa domain protein : SMC domain protein OS=Thermaerobacter marianensis (strain ATCC 700841 / DSM 12885 / JCM 10246 / 7p75a) GN=Tmar_0500 PE=4 SV=1: AAA_21: AAA_21 [Gemmata massiliana]|uniref:ATPase AAA-type core domain-containing protein n=1 Tax=Gemmata massiliana TaxID=1210884 RepID=A0A6P2CUS4_9BACT|nr:AAA family ATPase [Gemmata massiliana]VTR92663.1 aaa domain protein : SMC domain protein OS=Thermaerobacter marianensis (strain ATCC 700841 / DSM 12885 / JCM 10246 / 7p75a) GN=Tmar_0500 PE=4 SV=1: AAA_21: AAA_21 [Gemmata massiliana]